MIFEAFFIALIILFIILFLISFIAHLIEILKFKKMHRELKENNRKALNKMKKDIEAILKNKY